MGGRIYLWNLKERFQESLEKNEKTKTGKNEGKGKIFPCQSRHQKVH